MKFLATMSDFLKEIVNKVIILVFMLFLIFVGLPLLFVLFVISIIIRKLVSVLGKVIRPDLGKMLSAISSLLAVDYFSKDGQISSIVVYFRCKGKVNIDALKSRWTNEVIGIKKVGNDLKNIELKQYPYKWLGFIFWKWDSKFDISNHVKYYHDGTNFDKKFSYPQIEEIEHNFVLEQFPKNRSPWEMILIPNVQTESGEDETVILFRFHHSIADGFAILKFLTTDLADVNSEHVPRTQFAKQNIFRQFLSSMKFLKMPYEVAETLLEAYDTNDWIIPESELSKTWHSKVIDNISMDTVKEIKNSYNVSVTAVIFSGLIAAIRKAMLKKNKRIPQYIIAGVPFPVKGHPDKLRNFVTVSSVRLPVGEQDPVARLRKIEKTLIKLSNSTLPITTFIAARIGGCSFHWLLTFGAENNVVVPTLTASTMPGPKTKLNILGNEVLDCHSGLGPTLRGLGVMFNTITYDNYLKARFLVNDKLLCGKPEVEEMAADMINEFYILKDCLNNDV